MSEIASKHTALLLSHYTNLELVMEKRCTEDVSTRNLAEQELLDRNLTRGVLWQLNFTCKNAILPLAYWDLEYDPFMYQHKEIMTAYYKAISVYIIFGIVFITLGILILGY
jgi:hypothetical protein